MSTAETQPRGRTFFGQPLQLATLFGVETWERFSFYGMQAILAYYLYYSLTDGGLGMPEASATSIVGAYGGLVYLSAVVGAWIADRLLGAERTLFYGAVLVLIGHVSLALIPGLLGVGVGLVCVALGSGAIKTNATSVVGSLYAAGDERRDAGFSLFYLGVNLGAIVGQVLTPLTQTTLGFHYGFGLAAIGMALGLTQYALGRKRLPASASEVPNPLPRQQWPTPVSVLVVITLAVIALTITGVLTAANLSTATALVVVVLAVGYFALILTSNRTDADERSRMRGFIPLFIASVAFWSLFQQIFTTLAVYSDQRLNRDLFGFEVPAGAVASIEPVFIVIFAGVFAAMWMKLGPRQPASPIKFALGAGGVGLGFLLFLPMAGGTGNTSPLLAVLGILLVFAFAELCLSPVGLSLSTKVAPRAFRNQVVALFYLSVSLGSAMSGTLAGFYSPDHEAAYFGITGAVAIAIAVVIVLLSPMIKRQLRGVR